VFAAELDAQEPTFATAKTAHYTVTVEGARDVAEREALELGAVLEAAWKQFAEIAHAEPALKSPSAFLVKVQADKQSWLDAVSANGVEPGANLDALCYVPERDLVLIYRQPSAWFTRRMALHGAWQQFHCRAKSKHADLVNTWYVLGLAEQISQHRWDGRKLELAAHPRITVIDLPKQALSVFDPSEAGLKRFAEEGLRQPAMSWGLVSFLREGNDQKYRGRFDKLALGQTGSKLTGVEFAASLGKAGQISLEMRAWLESVQEPLEAACGDWEDPDGQVLLARAQSDDFAFALIKAKTAEISARFELTGDSAAGLVLAWTDRHHYTFAAVSDRGISVQRCEGDVLSVLGEYQAPVAVNGSHMLRAYRLDQRVTLFAQGIEIASTELAGDGMGFAVERGAARFLDVSWK
jgi:hypothetical protein